LLVYPQSMPLSPQHQPEVISSASYNNKG
jgi:hypothetical protein